MIDEKMIKEFEKEGRELGDDWIAEVDRTDAALSRNFVDFLVGQHLRPLMCEFTVEGLKFLGNNIVMGVMMVKMLECALEKVKATTRFTSMKVPKCKEKLLARLTGAFWLPFVAVLAPLGTHKQGEKYVFTRRKLEAYQNNIIQVKDPQKLLAKHFRTPRGSKWSDTASISDTESPMVCLCIGERAEGKGTQPEAEEGERKTTVKDLKAEIEMWRDRVEELDMIVEDLIDDNRSLTTKVQVQDEKIEGLRRRLASHDSEAPKRTKH